MTPKYLHVLHKASIKFLDESFFNHKAEVAVALVKLYIHCLWSLALNLQAEKHEAPVTNWHQEPRIF